MNGEREPVLDAIVLAAGAATRFGGGKLLARFAGGTVLGASLSAAFSPPVRSVLVVVGSQGDMVAAEARRAADMLGAGQRLRLVTAADWEGGMSASLRSGLAALDEDADGVFIFLGDMPRIPPSMLFRLAAAWRKGARAACPTYEGQRGHPALIGRALFNLLRTLSGDQGARAVLDALGPALACVSVDDPGVLQDVDTPADLTALADA